MVAAKSRAKRLVAGAAVTGCLLGVAGIPAASWAQGSGLTIFSGVERKNILDYSLDFDGRPDTIDRYRLKVPASKLKDKGAYKLRISYPDYYDGEFDPDKIEIRVDGDAVPLEQAEWRQEQNEIVLVPQQPLSGERSAEIVLSNVQNPDYAGTYYFHLQVSPQKGPPGQRYIGTWIVSIG
ncbi:MAG: hypothetical protein BRC58_05335 [Cyanobacteria bacterium QS_8_64_29]|nr:MAG: hypothetical protein BRC58_05335 [Cyanobacteria bacterium QS_8_64_29]